jgi:hypothetical protein
LKTNLTVRCQLETITTGSGKNSVETKIQTFFYKIGSWHTSTHAKRRHMVNEEIQRNLNLTKETKELFFKNSVKTANSSVEKSVKLLEQQRLVDLISKAETLKKLVG